MNKTDPNGVARAIGLAMIILPAGYLIEGLSGLCYASIVIGTLLILSNLDGLTDTSLN